MEPTQTFPLLSCPVSTWKSRFRQRQCCIRPSKSFLRKRHRGAASFRSWRKRWSHSTFELRCQAAQGDWPQDCVGVFQVKRLICTLTEERERFLEERRELLQKINKLEDEGVRSTSTIQHRYVLSITHFHMGHFYKINGLCATAAVIHRGLQGQVLCWDNSAFQIESVWINWCVLGSTCWKRKSDFFITKSRCSPDRTVP